MVLVAFAVMIAVLVGVMSPIPVWVSRALRGPLPRKALPAGDVRAAGGDAGAVLLTEINTAVDLVGAAWEAMADYKATAHVVWLLDRGANDNWAKSVVRRSQYDESEAAHAVERVITAVADLPPEDRSRLEDAIQPLSTLLLGRASAEFDEAPGRVLGRADAARAMQLLEQTLEHLYTLRDRLLSRKYPYR